MRMTASRRRWTRPSCPVRAGKTWVDVTVGEMYIFLGLRITMGAYPRQRMRMYWSSEDAELRLPSVADAMPRDRYEAILSHLSFMVVGDTTHAGDKLAKLRYIDTLLLKRCREAWQIEQHFTVDESRVKLSSKFCSFTWLMCVISNHDACRDHLATSDPI